MTATSYKCFPARTLLVHRRKEDSDHWLVAYRKTEQQKYRTVRRRIKEASRKQEKDVEDDAPRDKTLDGPFLLRLHYVDAPSELCSVDISEHKLNAVKPEDLKLFDNVAYVDASINALSLDSFSSFVSLRELNLSLNGLSDMTCPAADFPHLEVLDLSYNSLSADAIVSVGRLPHLKVLHLTGNQLHHLPPNLGSSNRDATQTPTTEEEDTRFKALEVLVLDDNKLSSGVFESLANLQRLKFLNLQGNRISEIPYLQPGAGSKALHTCTEDQAEEEAAADPNTGEHVGKISEHTWEHTCKGSGSPLPELQFLNLADNRIAEEEALMAAALFLRLWEIDIRSNPVTAQRSGEPPLLIHYLQERLGITIKHKKTQEVAGRPQRGLESAHPKWKEGERSSALLKMSVRKDAPTQPESEGKNNTDETLQENTQHLFLTQGTDVPEYEVLLQADENRNEDGSIPVKLTCYEMLADANPNPGVLQPVGIQTAVRMLEHTLRNLTVYTDTEPKSDCIQRPYRERGRKIKELPPSAAIKQPAQRVDELIKEMRASTTITEVSLSGAMDGAGVTRREALLLLKDMKTKYKMVHEKAMEREAGLRSVRSGEPTGAEAAPVQAL